MQDYSAQYASDAAIQGTSLILVVIYMIVAIYSIIVYWLLFEKAGKAGWKSIVPIYNMIVLLEIVGRPMWWFILMLIPLVNIVIAVIVLIDLGKTFGKSSAWSFFMLFLFSIIGASLLVFGDAKYTKPAVLASSAKK